MQTSHTGKSCRQVIRASHTGKSYRREHGFESEDFSLEAIFSLNFKRTDRSLQFLGNRHSLTDGVRDLT